MRIFLLDISRGLSVLAMIGYHFYWDLGYFGFVDMRSITQGIGLIIAQIIGISFITIAGISARLLSISKNFKLKFTKRFSRLVIISAIISIVTFLLDRNNFIFFGILHFLSVCSLISLPLINIRKGYLLFFFFVGATIISMSNLTYDLPISLSWLGFNKSLLETNDFYPVFPWVSFYLFGFWIGQMIREIKSKAAKNIFSFYPRKIQLLTFLEYVGKNSLIIYILHQPILFSLFFMFIQLTS